MAVRRLFPVAFLAAALASPAAAEVASKKYDWNPIGGVQDIDVQDGRIVVSQVEFDSGSTMRGTPIRKSTAKVKVRIDNNGDRDEEVGVAVVVFDAEGNVVAAGSNGTKWGHLNKGDRTYYSIDFPYMYRRLDKAASFLVTLETRDKSGRRRASQSGSSVSIESEPLPTPVP